MTLNEFIFITSTCWSEKYQHLTIDMTKDNFTVRYRLGINSIFIPIVLLFKICKLTEQQKNQRAEKFKNRISKQTHDINLAESLSRITKQIDEVKQSTQKLGDVFKENNTPQLAIVNTPTTHQPIENNDGTIYDVELENILKNMENVTGFSKTKSDPELGWMLNTHPIKTLLGTEVKINDNKCYITPGLQLIFTD